MTDATDTDTNSTATSVASNTDPGVASRPGGHDIGHIDLDGAKLTNRAIDQDALDQDKTENAGGRGSDRPTGTNGANAANAPTKSSLTEAKVEASPEDLEPDNLGAEKGLATEQQELEEGEVENETAETDPPETKEQKILAFLEDLGCKFFHTRDDDPYVTVPASPDSDARIAYSLDSAGFPSWLNAETYRRSSCALGESDLKEAMSLARMEATYNSPQGKVAIGVEKQGNVIYFDLRRKDGKVVRIDKHGWSVVSSAPVHFLRKKGTPALPLPTRSGSLRDIQSFVNVSEKELPLVFGFLVNQFYPEGTIPLLFLHGTAGSGKSTAARYLKAIVDPHKVLCQTLPRNEEDLLIASQHSSVLVFDNISGTLNANMSDSLCRLACGSGMRKRKLYKDVDEVAIKGKAGIILTSIDNVLGREDIIQRTLKVTLTDIDRVAEGTLDKMFKNLRAGILGSLFDAVSVGLDRLPDVKEDDTWDRPRLYDASEWAVACEPALPIEQGGFLRALQDRQDDMVADLVEDNPTYKALRKYACELEPGETETHTATTLSGALQSFVSYVPRAKSLSEDLNRNKEIYEDLLDLEIEKNPHDRDPETRLRQIHLTKLPSDQVK